MAVGLGMDEGEWKELRHQMDNSFWVMRIIGYPSLANDHDGYSCGAHKDYGCLTYVKGVIIIIISFMQVNKLLKKNRFLYTDSTPSALQVWRRAGPVLSTKDNKRIIPREEKEGQWTNVDPIPGCVVVNIGEMWQVWSNGLYKSTLHRVIHRGRNFR